MDLNFTTYQKVILTVYFVLGLPMLPIIPMIWLMKRYLFEDKKFLKPENRQSLIVEACSWMITYTIFFGGAYAFIRCVNPR
jgi:hypothetical protein